MRWISLLLLTCLTTACGTRIKEVIVPIEYKSTLNTLTLEDSATIALPELSGPQTAPAQILWATDSIPPPVHGVLRIYEVAVQRDSVYLFNESARIAFLAPVPGETLRIQQSADSIPQAVLEGEPVTEEITVEIRERESALDKAESFMGRIFGLIFKMLIILGIVVVLGIAGYITYAVIRSREQKKFTRGVADIATDLVSNLTKGKIKRK